MKAATVKKERRSWSVRFEGGKDEGLEVRLERRRDGTWRTLGIHTTETGKTRKHARGGRALTRTGGRLAPRRKVASRRRPPPPRREPCEDPREVEVP